MSKRASNSNHSPPDPASIDNSQWGPVNLDAESTGTVLFPPVAWIGRKVAIIRRQNPCRAEVLAPGSCPGSSSNWENDAGNRGAYCNVVLGPNGFRQHGH